MDVKLPDGTIARFPDDMPKEQITAVLRKKFAPPQVDERRGQSTGMVPGQESSYGDQLIRQIGLTGRYAVEGGMALPNMLGRAANSVVNKGIEGVNSLAGTDIQPLMDPAAATSGLLDNAGLPQPQNAQERVVGEASRFLASVPAMGGAAKVAGYLGVPGLTPLTENMGQQAAGAITGGGAYGTAKELAPNSPGTQVAAALLGGAMGGAGTGAISKLSSPVASAAAPTVESLKSAATAAYKTAEDAGVIVKPEAIKRLSSAIQNDLEEFGYHPNLQPRIATVLGEIERINKENITTKGLQVLRRITSNALMSNDPSERALGGRIVAQIDEFMGSVGPDDVVQGNAQQASQALKKGAELWKRMRKGEMIQEKEYNAELRAASSGSGGNADNAIRQNIKSILADPKKRRGFTADEQAAMAKVVMGQPVQDILRNVGKLSPQGSGLMAGIGILSSSANPATAPIFLGGMLAKKLADHMTAKNVRALEELILSGGQAEVAAPQPGLGGTLNGVISTFPGMGNQR